MAKWDILHVKSLEVEHAVPEEQVRQGLADGRISRDDCVRKPGDDRWWRIYELTEFRTPAGQATEEFEPPRIEDERSLRGILAEAEPAQSAPAPRPRPLVPPTPLARTRPAAPAPPKAPPAAPVAAAGPSGGDAPPPAPPGEEAGMPYRKKKHEEPEELDMTPMVDVAMQLILFFMVTSTMIMQTCIEFPKPAPDDRAQAQPTPQKLDDLKTDNIMVKVKADNTIYVDDDKESTRESDLIAKLTQIKQNSGRNGVIISVEDAAYFDTEVAVYDAADGAKIKPIKMAAPKKQDKKTSAKKKTIKD